MISWDFCYLSKSFSFLDSIGVGVLGLSFLINGGLGGVVLITE
jgi:hypothetical protein